MPTSRSPAYRIRTERLLARCWCPADTPRLRESLDASNQHLRPWIPFMKDEPRCSKVDGDEIYRYPLFTLDEADLVGEGMLALRQVYNPRYFRVSARARSPTSAQLASSMTFQAGGQEERRRLVTAPPPAPHRLRPPGAGRPRIR